MDKTISQSDALELIQIYINIILTKNNSKESLQNIALSIKDLFDYSLISNDKKVVEKVVNMLYEYISSNHEVVNFTHTILIIENIILSSSIMKDNSELINKIFECSIIMFNKTIEALNKNRNMHINDPALFLL